MVTVEHVETRAELHQAMVYLNRDAAALRRRGHDGTHLSCNDCERLGMIHANLDMLVTSWLEAAA